MKIVMCSKVSLNYFKIKLKLSTRLRLDLKLELIGSLKIICTQTVKDR